MKIEEIGKKPVLPDTSVIINGELSKMIREGKLKTSRVIISKFVLDELRAQASTGKDKGFKGLEEVKKLKKMEKEFKIKIEISGRKPTVDEISLAKKGRIDALIMEDAAKNKAVLVTSDYVQALVAEAEGINVLYIPFAPETEIKLEDFFDERTQSVHLKQGCPVYAKKGFPGEVKLEKIGGEVDEKFMNSLIENILRRTKIEEDSFLEISMYGAMVVQVGNYRVSITRPPFSDSTEITVVRPVVELKLQDYEMHEEIEKLIMEKSSGILISGPPGSGKSTFAASIANFLCEKGKIVKTFEQPRDLQVRREVTQYAPLEKSWENAAELLLLVRPDYVIFDEMRKQKDFYVFSDLRLAGVGMIGVVHSNDAISAIQRFIGRLELGLIPHVIDTVIFINAGNIEKVYNLEMAVKVPTGMKDKDLTRPVIEVRDFSTGRLEYEIYTYGEENIVVPVEEVNIYRKKSKTQVRYHIKESGKNVVILVDKRYVGNVVEIYDGRRFIFSARVGNGGKIKIRKGSEAGRVVMKAIGKGSLKIFCHSAK